MQVELMNPLPKLVVIFSRVLRGIAIAALTDDIAAALASVDLEKVCLSLHGNDAIDEAGKLPSQTNLWRASGFSKTYENCGHFR